MEKMEFLVLALSMMVAMVAPALAAQNLETSQGSYDVIVYISGTDILAEDSDGQVISSGTAGRDDSTVIQTAVKAISDGTILLQAGTYTLSGSTEVRVSNPEMGSLAVTSTPSGARIHLDGADTGKTTPYTFTRISPGVHIVSVELSGYITPKPQTVMVTAGGKATADLALEAEEPADVQKPYKAHTVPGRINFADFDFGGEGVAYHDTTAGNQGNYAYRTDDADVDTARRNAVNVPVIAHTYAGEWLQYSQVQVAESGTYAATFYTSTTKNGKSFSVLVDGEKVATVNVPNTGSWFTFAPTTVQIPLTAGEHTLKIAMDTGLADLAYVKFAPVAPTPTPTPSGKPDLVVTDISWDPANPVSGSAVTLKATIKNQGDAPTPARVKHSVLFTFDDGAAGPAVWSNTHTAPIAPGSWVTVTANSGSAGATWKSVEGTHTVKAHVDDVNRIAESDETNNVRTEQITVAKGTPTPTPTTPAPTPTPSGEYGADANPTGNPIGGGNGYTGIISRNDPRVKYIVDTRSELLSALQNARSGDVIYVEGSANIDLTGYVDINVPAGVTIASNRGENGAAGGRIYQTSSGWLFAAGGDHVRITGLCIEGPHKTTDERSESCAISTSRHQNLEVDNCEIWGWGYAAVALARTGGSDMKTGGYIHHNYIHHCQMNGLGYGVVVYNGATGLVEANYFDYCRHAIAGSGEPGDGYEARYNICGPNFIAIAAYQFDMHGKPDPSGSGTMAGDLIKIHHNTFMVTGSADPYAAVAAIICGVPRVGAYIDHNWFYYDQAPPIVQISGKGKITMTDNLIGQKKVLSSSGPIAYW